MVKASEAATNKPPGPVNRVLDFIASTGVFMLLPKANQRPKLQEKKGSK
jgi:hypothetical protein